MDRPSRVADVHGTEGSTGETGGSVRMSPTEHGQQEASHGARRWDGTAQAGWSDFAELARTRRSVRRYAAQPIAPALLEELLETATWAPSAHNRQPWRFCVITEAATKNVLSRAMGTQWRQDLTADGADPAVIQRRIAISHARMTGAAALVVACMSMADMDVYPDPARAQAEWTIATQSVALACQNLLLAAHDHGVGACWMCAPLFVPDLVRKTLALPHDWEPQALITLGYPAETKEQERAPLASRVVWR